MVLTAGIFILNKKRELLLAHPTNHPRSFFSVTKGAIEETDANPFEAALRETAEECNVNFNDYENVVYKLLTPVTFRNKRKKLTAFLVMAEENPHIDFDSFELKCNSNVEEEKGGFPEMDDFKYVSLSEAKCMVHESQVICIEEIEKIIAKL